VVDALARLRAASTGADEVLVKLNEGVSGGGNALVDLRGLPPSGSANELPELRKRARAMRFERPDMPFDAYVAKLAERGGIVEERMTGVELRSPSVQLRVTPLGDIELLSTHDQLLGGPSGQSYLGCRFPADFAYARAISADASIIGIRLAREGVLGRFAIDFVVVRDTAGTWTPYAIELNLRKGGTTHPFLTMQFLADGRYDAATALFVTPEGREKHLVATDHLEDPLLRGLRYDDLFDIVARHGLHFDQARQAGVVFHMISCLSEHGRVGLTAVGDTPTQAEATYRRAERILLEEARSALVEPGLVK
jgi:PGM1 C-terminal domain